MKAGLKGLSSFPIDLGRIALVGYLLGAVVPLVGLGVLVGRHTHATSSGPDAAALGLAAAIGGLSLGCFLMLRRKLKRSLSEMGQSNSQLGGLLNSSRALASAHSAEEAIDSAVHHALALTGADAACVLLRRKPEDSLEMTASAGIGEIADYESMVEPLADLADLAMSGGRPLVSGASATAGDFGDSGVQSAAILPLSGEKSPIGALAVLRTHLEREFDSCEMDALTTLAGLTSVAMVSAELRFAQRNFFTHVTDILVQAIDIHLGYNGGHGRRVAHLANRIARKLDLDEGQRENLHFAALLHDIGMLKIDRSSPHSAKFCRNHPTLGFRMLNGIRLWDDVAPLVLYHHEWFDGTGYPEGLAGEDIPLGARIIALCEAFDSMTASTSYRSPLSIDEAALEIKEGSGTQFDPDVADAFREIFEQGDIAE